MNQMRRKTPLERIKITYSFFGKKLGRPVFKYRTAKASKKHSKPIQSLLNYYKNNMNNLEDLILSGQNMGLLLEFLETTKDLEGNILELGTYKGGSTIMFAKFLQHLKSKKRIFACDTFTGFPYEDIDPTEQKRIGNLRDTSFEHVSEKFKKFNVSDKITIIKGKFEDTLFQRLSDLKFSFVLFDADLYKSTKFALDFVYPRLINDGIMAFQDYELGNEKIKKFAWGERQAVDEFFSLHNLKLSTEKSIPYFQLKNIENVDKNF